MATLLQIVAPLVWPSVARTLVFSIVALVAPFGCGDARAAPVVAPGKAGVAAASPGPAPSVRAAEPLWPPISNLSPALWPALPAVSATSGDDPLTVQVLTFGPGSHPFTRFGHNALRLIDRNAQTDIVYNFGTFAFDSPRLIIDFLKGRLRYWLSRASMGATVHVYRRENRTIEVQELALTPDEKRELARRLEVNARPENRDYRYDYFADNCSTRVRDALDGVLGGRLRTSATTPGGLTLRGHALRMAAPDLPLYLALLIVLGPRADRPIDEWAEAFLPEMLQRTLRGAVAGDFTAAARGERLVRAEQVLFTADRLPPPREPPQRLPQFLGAGALGGMLMYLLARAGKHMVALRILLGLITVLLGIVVGVIGCFLVGAWAFTPHVVVYRNENVLLFAPFTLALAVYGWGVAAGRAKALRRAFMLSAAALALVVVACALKLFPWSRQDNGALILLMLPFWAGTAGGLRTLVPAAAPASAGGSPPLH